MRKLALASIFCAQLIASSAAFCAEFNLSSLLGDKFMPRAKWGAIVKNHEALVRSGKLQRDDAKEIVTLHHTVDQVRLNKDGNPSLNSEKNIVRCLDQYCTQTLGWSDIGYHFLIGPSGRIYEGRPYEYVGAHTMDLNERNAGIAFIGCFDESECEDSETELSVVTEEMIDSAIRLIVALSIKDNLVISHQSIMPRSTFEEKMIGYSRFPHSPGNLIVDRLDEMVNRSHAIKTAVVNEMRRNRNSSSVYLRQLLDTMMHTCGR